MTSRLWIFHPRVRRDLTTHQHHTGFNQGLTRHARRLVLLQYLIQNSIRYLIGDFVRMTF
jgi:hypothetical protein